MDAVAASGDPVAAWFGPNRQLHDSNQLFHRGYAVATWVCQVHGHNHGISIWRSANHPSVRSYVEAIA